MTVMFVDRFYTLNIPHYDSVGTLTYGFRILNAYAAGGYAAAFALLGNYADWTALSYTQAWFAAVFAPFLEKSPSSFQLYNTIATALGMTAIFIFARGAGFRFASACLAALIYLLPDGLWRWEFGIVDYRRDTGMLGLLTASLFVLLTLYTGPWSPRARTALSFLLGILAGLAALSRDSAPLYVGAMVGVPWLVLAGLDARRSGLPSALRLLVPATVGLLPFAIYFALNAKIIYSRLADPLIGFGGGGDRWDSLTKNLWAVDGLVRGDFNLSWPSGAGMWAITIAGIAATMFAIWTLRFAAPVAPAARRIPRPDWVALITGLWGVVWLHLFLSLYVGWRSSLPFTALAPPYLPVLLGIQAVVIAIAARFTLRTAGMPRLACLVIGAAVVFGAAAIRLESHMTETPAWMRQANDGAAGLRALNGGSPSFAELTFETVQIPMVAYRMQQQGLAPPQRIRFRNRRYDTAIGIPPTEAEREALLGEMETAIRCDADFVVVSTRPEDYADSRSPLLIFRHGGAIAAEMISSLPIAAGPYGDGKATSVVILDNRSRANCASPTTNQ